MSAANAVRATNEFLQYTGKDNVTKLERNVFKNYLIVNYFLLANNIYLMPQDNSTSLAVWGGHYI